MVPLFQELTTRQANTYSLILSSVGIFYQARKEITGWQIWVHERDYSVAMNLVEKYFEENKEPYRPPPPPTRKIVILNGIWVSLLLLAVFVAVGKDRDLFHNIYAASAAEILDGEIYRAVTALLLHADAVHLLSNMAAIALFGAVVCSMNGTGAGWFLILLSGISGNLLNAVLRQSAHSAVGASTAVFGAVGMMAAYQFWRKIRVPKERFKAWLPLAGGMALLAMLGAGEGRVDVMAHLFGFIAGIVIQSIFDLKVKQELSLKVQGILAAFALVIVSAASLWPIIFSS
jgi:rhomboid protease GluP